MIFRFGPFVLDAAGYRLLREGRAVDLSPRLVDLLRYLIERPSSLITKEELFEAIWPDVTVTDNALTRAVSEIRQALGDDPSAPAYIQTVARRGYRFIGQVVADARPTASAVSAVASAGGTRARETSSLDAFRQLTEGRLHLESLDLNSVPEAIAHFEQAIAIDPGYALAHIGLANARFWAYELTRERNVPDTAMLATAIADVRRAIELDPRLAEAHATLSFLLVSAGRFPEAQAEAMRAMELEPGYWGHAFRLGHASWGDARLRALASALELYPDFAFAHFEIAMVWIARGRLDQAEAVLREGLVVLDRQVGRRERFPASGLHWMLGLVRLARGDAEEAEREFLAEIATGGERLYAREFAIAAYNALGGAAIETDAPERAATHLRRALEIDSSHARSLVAVALATRAPDDDARARAAVNALARGPRVQETALLRSMLLARQQPAAAIAMLQELLASAPAGHTGWTIPIEPLLQPLRFRPEYEPLLAALAQRAE